VTPRPVLLAEDDPAPVIVHGRDRPSHYLIVCDHAGNAIPRSLGTLGIPKEFLKEHIAVDCNILPVAMATADGLDAMLIAQAYSRLVVDCNRRPTAADSILPVSDSVEIPGNAALSEDERAARIEAIFAPYHAEIGLELERRRNLDRECAIISMHSFTPQLRGGAPRPWTLGVISGPDCRLGNPILQRFRQEPDLIVGQNEPYRISMEDDYTLPVHGEGTGTPYVEIEVRNDLIAAEEDRKRIASVLVRGLHDAWRDLDG
jgi:predicted N-formylglutamate amidohydrolase